MREQRSFKAQELRAEEAEGKRYLNGYAATFNTLADLGWLQERIVPGAFSRALREKQDVRHLINHDPNKVLGRTKAGTTELTEDAKRLKFRTELPDTGFARDLFASVSRGDVDECSFAFSPVRTVWIDEPDPDDDKRTRSIRELHDVDLFDVSTVTYPAYPGTNTTAEQKERSLFPEGVPAELRSRMEAAANREYSDDSCQCQCQACLDGDCEECSNEDCTDENCRCMDAADRAKRKKAAVKVKLVDGEALPAESFLIVGDKEDTRTWKLPVKFATEEKTKAHLLNDLVRFNQLRNVSDEIKAEAWGRLVTACRGCLVDVSESGEQKGLRKFLTADQIYDFEKESVLALADVRMRSIQASL